MKRQIKENLDAPDYEQLMLFSMRHARKAGKILLKNFGKIESEREKNDKDPVTNVDLEAQKYYVKQIKRAFPGHGILGEESGSLGDEIGGREFQWIIDPLDGTVNYSAGIPLFCTSIGVARNGESVAGAVYDPILKEMFHAWKGGGAFLNAKPIKSLERPLRECVIAISLSSNRDKNEFERKLIAELNPSVRRFRALGSIAHEVCHIAAGRLAASIHTTNTAWDGVAANLIAAEAGCIVTNLDGAQWNLEDKSLVVSANKEIHGTVMKAINKVK